MVIVRVTRQQLDYLSSAIHADRRRMIKELTFSNIYLQEQNLLFVASDDVEFVQMKEDELPISIARAVSEVYEQTKRYGVFK